MGVKVNGPCQDCPDRSIGCHGTCERYKTYRTTLDEWKRQNRPELSWTGWKVYLEKRKHHWRSKG